MCSATSRIAGEKPYRIIQITDSHLGGSRDQTLLGINNYQSLELVVELVKQQEGQNFDRILASGDVSFDQSEQSYRDFLELMAPFQRPVSWLPGNHDSPEMMDGITGDLWLESEPVIELGDWQLILLNSNSPGEIGGQFEKGELHLLENALAQNDTRHALIGLHHHPVPVGCDWMASQQLANADEFFEIVDKYPSVKLVVWGHIHQEFDALRNQLRLLATPSTCHQFEPQQKPFTIGRQLPGYRWIDLYPSGIIETGVARIKSTPFEIDYQTKGY